MKAETTKIPYMIKGRRVVAIAGEDKHLQKSWLNDNRGNRVILIDPTDGTIYGVYYLYQYFKNNSYRLVQADYLPKHSISEESFLEIIKFPTDLKTAMKISKL